MTNEMKQFLTELAELLEKHDVQIEAEDYSVLFYMPKRLAFNLKIIREMSQVEFQQTTVDADDINELLK